MANANDPSEALKRLSDSDLAVADPAQDIRGREVQDSGGEKIGKVGDLFIDESERRVRFIEVESGGFLGIGASKLLVPVESVRSLTKSAVVVGHGRQHLAGAPQYDPTLLDEDFLRQTYSYYGYPPYWTSGYAYPERWFL